jgi:hypothetical protein
MSQPGALEGIEPGDHIWHRRAGGGILNINWISEDLCAKSIRYLICDDRIKGALIVSLNPGDVVTLQCLGTVQGQFYLGYLDGNTTSGSVQLQPTIAPSGTRWLVIDAGGGVIHLQCLGDTQGPFYQAYLDGNTGTGSVRLSTTTDSAHSGTNWSVLDTGGGEIHLQNQGTVQQAFYRGYLDGNTTSGSVQLQHTTDYTGTNWSYDEGD